MAFHVGGHVPRETLVSLQGVIISQYFPNSGPENRFAK